ncbi:MAG: LysR family transcriptional regulator [Lachnospiraceae bacterium]
MDLLQLKYFKRVTEFESITKAADSLSVAQPAVSKMIKQLEEELHGPLFDRVGRNIRLNDRGRLLLAYTTEILNNIDRIYDSLQSGSSAKEKIYFSVTVCSSLIPKILSEFSRLHPDYQIVINTSGTRNPVDIELFQSLNEYNEENIHTILKEEIVLAVPREHPLSDLDSINLHEIQNYTLIGLKPERSYMKLMEPFFKIAGVTPDMSLEIDNPETLRKLINIGYGLSFVPRKTWIDTDTEHVKFISINSPNCYRLINLKWKEGYLSPAVLSFKDFLMDFFTNRL